MSVLNNRGMGILSALEQLIGQGAQMSTITPRSQLGYQANQSRMENQLRDRAVIMEGDAYTGLPASMLTETPYGVAKMSLVDPIQSSRVPPTYIPSTPNRSNMVQMPERAMVPRQAEPMARSVSQPQAPMQQAPQQSLPQQSLPQQARMISPQQVQDMGGSGVRMTPEQLANRQEPEDDSILGRLKSFGTKAMDFAQKTANYENLPEGLQSTLGNEEWRIRKAMALNSMRTNYDPELQRSLAGRLEAFDEARKVSVTAQAVSNRLRQMGPEYAQYADMIEQNPSLANEVMKQILQKEFKPESAIKTSGPQVDPVTGQLYVVKTDPNTGETTRQDVEGAMGMTEAGKLALQVSSEDKARDIQAAQEAGRSAFSRATALDGQISRLQNASDALDRGAVSGWIQQYLPAMDAATADLRATANSLGIDIINSATFGALSEKELALALSTGLPTELSESELKKYINEKIAAQSKLRNELLRDARELVGGQTRYSQYITRRADQALKNAGDVVDVPAGVDPKIWNAMTPEERATFK